MATKKVISDMSNRTFQKEASKNMFKKFSAPNEGLSCDICNSVDIEETTEGYVCRSCGLVLEIQKLEYHRPYNSDVVQHATLGITQIGSAQERFRNGNSKKLDKLNKLHSMRDNEENVLLNAKLEMRRIFDVLNLPSALKYIVLNKFIKLRECLNPGTKYRAPEKLIPITIYFVCKFENISIHEAELLEVSKITKKEFNWFKLQFQNYIPQYKERDRKQYIIQRILEISEHFNLGMDFYYQSKLILYKLWDAIKNTKDDVIAGLVCSISLLCVFNSSKVTVNSICTKLGIKMSTIQSQVKKKIFEQFKIPGFTTLINSTDLLQKVIDKMGLLKYSASNSSENDPPPEILDVKLEKGSTIKCHMNDSQCFLYAICQGNRRALLISMKPFTINNELSKGNSPQKIKIYKGDLIFELELLKFKIGKDPPHILETSSC
jgi:transcription initiation factor TFIIIB Brf1 subunit/transcription initiation factor TFIIB